MHVPLTVTQQPFLHDVLAQLPDDAVTVIDLTTEADWSASQGLDSLETTAAVVHSLPIGAHDDPFDIYGNYKLQNEDWDHLALGDRARIVARARAVARRLGLDAHMSDDALYEALYEKRARRSPDNARLLAANRALHAALAAPPLVPALQHVDFTLHRSDFGVRSVRNMVVRVYRLPTLLVATEVRAAGSVGDARGMWACAALNVTNQAHRIAVLYAAPLPFRECFLQLDSPPLARFARTLHNFPWLPLATTCRDAIGFFDWHRATPELDVRALLQRWRAMPAAERAALVHRRVEAAEARVRALLGGAPGPHALPSGSTITSPSESESAAGGEQDDAGGGTGDDDSEDEVDEDDEAALWGHSQDDDWEPSGDE
jgi:hypothetical protein